MLGGPIKHTDAGFSAGAIDFEKGVATGAGTINTKLIIAHAILMVIAWLFLASNGVLFARESFQYNLNL